MAKIFWIAIIIILIVGTYMIIESKNLDIEKSEDRKTFAKEFWGWTKQVGKSSANVVGYAVKQDWLPNTDKSDECKNSDEQKIYVSKDEECKLNFICEKNAIPFKDECGCGCKIKN